MSHVARWAAVAVLAVPALFLADGCSSQAGTSAAAPSHQATATATATAPVTGRTLTEAQLASAGLTTSELPKDFTFTPYPDGHWSPATPATAMPTAKPGCQPLVDLLFGTSDASAEVAVGYQGSNAADVGDIRLASYTPSQADTFFQSVRQALEHCPDIAYTSYVGPNDATFKLLPSPGLGDDSLSFGEIRQGGSGTTMDGIDYVRVGAATVLVTLLGFNMTFPPLSHDLLTAQVSKLRTTQG